MTKKTIKMSIIVGTSLIILKNFDDLVLELFFKIQGIFLDNHYRLIIAAPEQFLFASIVEKIFLSHLNIRD
jgi:hypothetical protein